MSRFLLAALPVVFLFGSAVLADDAKRPTGWDEPLPVSDNAALTYWQAMAVLPKAAADPKGPFWNPVRVDSPACKEFFAESRPAMQLLRLAATRPRCDWGIDWNAPTTSSPANWAMNARVRDLARLAKFRVEFLARDGKPEEAAEEGMAMYALARNFSREQPTLMSWLVACAMEFQAIETLAEVVPQLNRIELFRLSRRFDALPPRSPLADAIRLESRGAWVWMSRAIKEGPTTEGFDVFKGIWDEGWLEEFIEQARKDPESARMQFDELSRRHEEWIELLALPQAEFDKRSAEMVKNIKEQGNPVVMGLMSTGMGSSYNGLRRVEARSAALLAGIAYLREGEAGLLKYPDPVDGKPFSLTKTAIGFELRSRLMHIEKNQPVVVQFGLPADAK